MVSKRERAFELFDEGYSVKEAAEIIADELGEENTKTLKNTIKTYRQQWKMKSAADRVQAANEGGDMEESEEYEDEDMSVNDIMKDDLVDTLREALPKAQESSNDKPIMFSPVEENPIDSLKTEADVYKFVIEDAIKARYIPESQRETLMTWLMIHDGKVQPVELYSRLTQMGGAASKMAKVIVDTYSYLLNKLNSGTPIDLSVSMFQQKPPTPQIPTFQQQTPNPQYTQQYYQQPPPPNPTPPPASTPYPQYVIPPVMPPQYPHQYPPQYNPQQQKPMTQEEMLKMIEELEQKKKHEQELASLKSQVDTIRSEFSNALGSIKEMFMQKEHEHEKEDIRRQYEGMISSLEDKINKLQDRIEHPPMSEKEIMDNIIKELSNRGMLGSGPNPEVLDIQRQFEKDKLEHVRALKKLEIEEEGNKAMASLLDLAPAIGAAAAQKIAQSSPPPEQSPSPANEPQGEAPQVTMLPCPKCGNDIAVPAGASEVTCDKCGSSFRVE